MNIKFQYVLLVVKFLPIQEEQPLLFSSKQVVQKHLSEHLHLQTNEVQTAIV